MFSERNIGRMRAAVLACLLIAFAAAPIRAMAAEKGREKPARSTGGETVVVPKINVLSQYFWADGTTPVIITISLEEARGSERIVYQATKEIAFHLEPATGTFDPVTVTIPAGKSVSAAIKLTTKQPGVMEISCTPERRYEGISFAPCQSEKREFLVPIHGIGIEPVTDQCPINIVKAFRVYLYNQSAPQTQVAPGKDVSVHLTSENGNGSVLESDIKLTSSDPSRFVHYSPTRTGKDRIIATADYAGGGIRGISPRDIVFPWLTLFAGAAGALIGSLLRSAIGKPEMRKQNFFESFVFGFAFCLIVILYPTGTKLPSIGEHLQPGLLFALAILVGGLGPEFLKQLLALVIPQRAAAQ